MKDIIKWNARHPDSNLSITLDPQFLFASGSVYQMYTVEMSEKGTSLKVTMADFTLEILDEIYDILTALQEVSNKRRRRR